MTNTPITAGSKSYILWKKETEFNTAVVPDTHFGLDTNFSRNFSNDLKLRKGMAGSTTSGRDTQKILGGKTETTNSVEFDLNDPNFLEFVLGDKTVSTYSGSEIPPSITIANCLDNVTTDRDELFSGVVCNRCTIKGAEGEPITVSLDLMAADFNKDTALTANVAIVDQKPFTFANGTFELPNATAITNVVNSFEFTINNNWTMHYGPNNKPQYATPGERVYTMKLETKYVDDDLLDKALGSTGGINADGPTINASMELVLTRPNNDTLTLLTGGIAIGAHNLTAQLNNPVGESIDLSPKTVTIVESIA